MTPNTTARHWTNTPVKSLISNADQPLKRLLSQLEKLARHFPGCTFKLCYEASYIGFTLQRDLMEKGYGCEVVAPTSIPSPRGKQIKTDHIDASQLAQYYTNGLLTLV